jgi:hypothetical protein
MSNEYSVEVTGQMASISPLKDKTDHFLVGWFKQP